MTTTRFPEVLDAKRQVPIHAVPKSPRNAVEGWVEDAAGRRWLKVRICAAPEDGKANKSLLKFLAKEWGVPPASLSIVSGETSRYKRVQWMR